MKQLCLSFYNVNILQLNVAMWGTSSSVPVVVCTCWLPYWNVSIRNFWIDI